MGVPMSFQTLISGRLASVYWAQSLELCTLQNSLTCYLCGEETGGKGEEKNVYLAASLCGVLCQILCICHII